ncbi:rhomboid family intramembrane serine protease [Tundrisphaera lichenicola]|uniref:rhomboid family intramembrane serine protease n=1 Tax=Tundrisphaera lichenicola TaxID=2029860 RepID=UPI003EB884C6
MALAASWVLVFALCQVVQLQHREIPVTSSVGPLPVALPVAHRFGDMTWSEVRRGEPWRLVTATFVHYSLLHLGMNTLSLIMLGRLIEPWYGPGPFLGICLTIGGLGNLTGGLLRQLIAMARPWVISSAAGRHWPGLYDRFFHVGPDGPSDIPSGGGSTIILGLIGLAAVVGWRSRTRIGSYLSKQMITLLGFTAILGVAFFNLIDNYGHTGGAIVGAALGFVHRPILRAVERKSIRRLSWFAVGALMTVCLAAGVRDDRAEQSVQQRLIDVIRRGQATEQTLFDLEKLYTFHGRRILSSPEFRDPFHELDALAMLDLLAKGPKVTLPAEPDPAQVARERAEIDAILERLGQTDGPPPWDEATAANLDRLRSLGLASLQSAPNYPQAYEFVVCYRAAFQALAADLARSKAELREIDRLARAVR